MSQSAVPLIDINKYDMLSMTPSSSSATFTNALWMTDRLMLKGANYTRGKRQKKQCYGKNHWISMRIWSISPILHGMPLSAQGCQFCAKNRIKRLSKTKTNKWTECWHQGIISDEVAPDTLMPGMMNSTCHWASSTSDDSCWHLRAGHGVRRITHLNK